MILFYGPLLVAAASLVPADTVPQALQGDWAPEALMSQRCVVDPAQEAPFNPRLFQVKRDRLTIRLYGGGSVEGELSTEDWAAPKSLDVRLSGGRLFRGIYAVDGNVLVVCVQMKAGKKRPTTFSTLVDDGTVLYIFRRQPQ